MPKLWTDTIEAHRREVHVAILDTTARLVAHHGLRAVPMSQVAEETGIGRATLYKYFPNVDAILFAWHERQIAGHLEQLGKVGADGGTPGERLEAVLEAYARICYARHDTEMASLLHQGPDVARASRRLTAFLRELLTAAVTSGDARADVPPGELATYCRHAIEAATSLSSKAAVRRLVQVTLAGLRPDSTTI